MLVYLLVLVNKTTKDFGVVGLFSGRDSIEKYITGTVMESYKNVGCMSNNFNGVVWGNSDYEWRGVPYTIDGELM